MSIDEIDFTHLALAQLGTDTRWRVWRQNCGEIPVRDRSGKVVRVFHPGPPHGAADISGIVRDGGWRLEVELKMPRGKRSKAQIAWAKMIEGAGGVYVLYTYDDDVDLAQNCARLHVVVSFAVLARRQRA